MTRPAYPAPVEVKDHACRNSRRDMWHASQKIRLCRVTRVKQRNGEGNVLSFRGRAHLLRKRAACPKGFTREVAARRQHDYLSVNRKTLTGNAQRPRPRQTSFRGCGQQRALRSAEDLGRDRSRAGALDCVQTSGTCAPWIAQVVGAFKVAATDIAIFCCPRRCRDLRQRGSVL